MAHKFKNTCEDCNIAYNTADCPLCKSEADRLEAEAVIKKLTGDLIKMGMQYEM